MDKSILASSRRLEELSESPMDSNKKWFERSRDIREMLLDLVPHAYDRISEYVKTRMEEPEDQHKQSEFALKLINTGAMPQPTINFNQVNQISQNHQFRHYSPPVIVTKQEMIEATRIALESREEEKKIKGAGE